MFISKYTINTNSEQICKNGKVKYFAHVCNINIWTVKMSMMQILSKMLIQRKKVQINTNEWPKILNLHMSI